MFFIADKTVLENNNFLRRYYFADVLNIWVVYLMTSEDPQYHDLKVYAFFNKGKTVKNVKSVKSQKTRKTDKTQKTHKTQKTQKTRKTRKTPKSQKTQKTHKSEKSEKISFFNEKFVFE